MLPICGIWIVCILIFVTKYPWDRLELQLKTFTDPNKYKSVFWRKLKLFAHTPVRKKKRKKKKGKRALFFVSDFNFKMQQLVLQKNGPTGWKWRNWNRAKIISQGTLPQINVEIGSESSSWKSVWRKGWEIWNEPVQVVTNCAIRNVIGDYFSFTRTICHLVECLCL